jgi:hypothetical protein
VAPPAICHPVCASLSAKTGRDLLLGAISERSDIGRARDWGSFAAMGLAAFVLQKIAELSPTFSRRGKAVCELAWVEQLKNLVTRKALSRSFCWRLRPCRYGSTADHALQ